jgi:hypothetical protein
MTSGNIGESAHRINVGRPLHTECQHASIARKVTHQCLVKLALESQRGTATLSQHVLRLRVTLCGLKGLDSTHPAMMRPDSSRTMMLTRPDALMMRPTNVTPAETSITPV